jgi:hypothetical protein
MGDVFRKSGKYYPTNAPTNAVIVEIGSDRFEGSTIYYSTLAQKHNTELYSVDVLPEASERLGDVPNTKWCVEKGSVWSKDGLLGKTISCLYLDNYDYIWEVGLPTDHIDRLKGLNNQDCALEHLQQMINLLPYMCPEGIVVCDDTYTFNGCWIGKCGAVVTYLLAHGYEIVENDDRLIKHPPDSPAFDPKQPQTQSNGLILKAPRK